jgi:hypothetical protein
VWASERQRPIERSAIGLVQIRHGFGCDRNRAMDLELRRVGRRFNRGLLGRPKCGDRQRRLRVGQWARVGQHADVQFVLER